MVYRILVASYTNEIYTLVFDPDATSLELVSTITVGHHPSWITPHPKDKSIVYTGLEQSDGKIVALKYDAEGRGTVIGEIPSEGADPCALLALENELIIGNYSSGRFVAVPFSAEPPHILGSSPQILQFAGTGPDKDRQEAPHPHQVIRHPTRDEVLVPDLGSDKTRRLARGADGKWVEKGVVSYKAGSGPRHVAFYEDVLYTVLELTSEVSAHRFPPLPAEPTLLDTVPTMRNPPPSPDAAFMLAAEILLPPPNTSFPNPYIYVSNRNDPSPEGDIIAIYSPVSGESAKIGHVAEVRSGLKHLRGMEFGGPDGKYLIAGGVHGGGVKVFERVDGGKGLKEVAVIELAAPTGFLWL
ncbi:putative isomerase YbhE [Trametes versicolor FP-101664 SS1]|uniref:putative isomerase YbhE n=1 Tax=Trametes versicolor (strain FP-101664) TaxID=717944 RepID=UPI00046233F2|nr:putative isomerase YbhE [Trametes versicolor FP-101664 SS1]EIW54158.1 putative isomerase YbhE [Trametes versicolor FP-101664 SS1]